MNMFAPRIFYFGHFILSCVKPFFLDDKNIFVGSIFPDAIKAFGDAFEYPETVHCTSLSNQPVCSLSKFETSTSNAMPKLTVMSHTNERNTKCTASGRGIRCM